MSTEYGASHVWGIPVGNADEALNAEIERYMHVASVLELEPIESVADHFEGAADSPEALAITELARKVGGDMEAGRTVEDVFRDRLVAAFVAKGTRLPESAELHWTGDGNDRPGRCNIGPHHVIIGFGMFRDPSVPLPALDPHFRDLAEHLTWIWGG